MYKQATLDGDDMAQCALAARPLGPGFSKEQVDAATSMEVWVSSFADPGPDYTRFDLKKGGKVVATVLIPGY